jgi:hypothetical protein
MVERFNIDYLQLMVPSAFVGVELLGLVEIFLVNPAMLVETRTARSVVEMQTRVARYQRRVLPQRNCYLRRLAHMV